MANKRLAAIAAAHESRENTLLALLKLHAGDEKGAVKYLQLAAKNRPGLLALIREMNAANAREYKRSLAEVAGKADLADALDGVMDGDVSQGVPPLTEPEDLPVESDSEDEQVEEIEDMGDDEGLDEYVDLEDPADHLEFTQNDLDVQSDSVDVDFDDDEDGDEDFDGFDDDDDYEDPDEDELSLDDDTEDGEDEDDAEEIDEQENELPDAVARAHLRLAT